MAARLTGWRIDIKSETQLEEEEAGLEGQEWAEGEWVEDESGNQVWKPAEGGEVLSAEEWSTAAVDEAAVEAATEEAVATDAAQDVVEEVIAEEIAAEAQAASGADEAVSTDSSDEADA